MEFGHASPKGLLGGVKETAYVNTFVSDEIQNKHKASSWLAKSNTLLARQMETGQETLGLITKTPWEDTSGAGHENLSVLLQLSLSGIPKFRAEVQPPRNLFLHKFELPKSLWSPGMMWLQGMWVHWHQEPLHKSRSRCRWPQIALSKVTWTK